MTLQPLELCQRVGFLIAASLALVGLAACKHQEGLLTHAPLSYVVFSGRAGGASVKIDDSPPISLTQGNVSSKTRFSVEPGQHHIRIEKRGAVVLDRVVLLVDQQAMEIPVP